MLLHANNGAGLARRQLIVVAALLALLALQVGAVEHVHADDASAGCEVCHHAADAPLPDAIAAVAPGLVRVPHGTALRDAPTTPPTAAFSIRAPPTTS